MKPVFNPFTSKLDWVFDKASEISIVDAGSYYTGTDVEAALQEIGAGTTLDSRYLKLDASNSPLTGNLGITKADPEFRLTDSGNSEYSRLLRSDTDNQMNLYNRVSVVATGSPYAFSGTGAYRYITLPNNAALRPTAGITIEAWIKPTNAAHALQPIFVQEDVYGTKKGFQLFTSANSLYWRIGDGTTAYTVASAAGSIVNNTWYHCVGTWDGTTQRLYINNVEVGTPVTWSGSLAWNAKSGLIGNYINNASYNFTGLIDECKQYNIGITAAQVSTSYNGGAGLYGSAESGLLVGYHLDEGTGTAIADYSGNGYNGTGTSNLWAVSDKALPADVVEEVSVIQSIDSAVAGQKGIHTVGVADGRTNLAGDVYINSLTASRAIVTDANGLTASSAVTGTELGYLSGVTSAIQTQLNGKVNDTGDTMTGNYAIGTSLASWGAGFNALQIGQRSSILAGTSSDVAEFANNSYWNGSSYVKLVSGAASKIAFGGGVFDFASAPTGTGSFSYTSRFNISNLGVVTVSGLTASRVLTTNASKQLESSAVTLTELGILSGATISTAELNLLDGVTATTAELNYTDGVTSNIQTQLNTKLANIVEDTTPQLGGYLDTNGNYIELSGIAGAIRSSAGSPFYQKSYNAGSGTAPSQADGGIVSYWTFDDNGIFPEDSTDANLLIWCKFDDGTGVTATDETGTYNGTLAGNAAWTATGAFTESTFHISLDGTTDYINYGDNSNFTFGNGSTDSPFSINIWAKIDSYAAQNSLVSKYVTGAREYLLYIDSAGLLRGIVADESLGGFIRRLYNTALTDTTNWHMYTMTYDGSGVATGIKLYIDSVQVDDTTANNGSFTAMENTSANLCVGAYSDGAAATTGDVDNFSMYTDVLTAEEILRMYRKTQGTHVADYVGANHGELNGDTAFVDPGYFQYTGDEALTFDGTTDFVDLGTASDITSLTEGSVGMWVKGDVGNTGQAFTVGDSATTLSYYVIGSSNQSGTYYYGFRYSNNGTDTINAYAAGSSARADDGEWHHIVLTVDSSGNKFFIDGVEQTMSYVVGSSANSQFFSANASHNIVDIGYRGSGTPGGYWTGDIDNVIVYNDVRTAAEVLADYEAGLSSGTYFITDTNETSGASGKLESWRNNGTEKVFIDAAGGINLAAKSVLANEVGTLEYDGNALGFTPKGDQRSVSLANGVILADTTVANTVTETTIFTESVAANELYKGLFCQSRVSGFYSTANGTDTFTLRVKVDGTTIETITSTAANVTNASFVVDFDFTVRSSGATGTIIGGAWGTFDDEAKSQVSTSTNTIDTTGTAHITVTVEWSNALAGNTLTINQGFSEFKGVKQA